jgi:alpha-1,3-mannosyltransferase
MSFLYLMYAGNVFQTLEQTDPVLKGEAPRPVDYVKAIMDPTDTSFDRLSCPPIGARYYHLRPPSKSTEVKFFFALDMFNSASVLPTLLGAVVQAMGFLGAEHCALSIVEGRSTDATYDIVAGVGEEMERLGSKFYLGINNTDPMDGSVDRIAALAGLRNQALRPLIDNHTLYSRDTIIVFLNDVILCADDILELLHQQVIQSADVSCAMDWNDKNNDVLFYDSWVARGISGDTFFEIPQSSEWTFAHNLFWNDPLSKQKFEAKETFQVYACWNGMAVFRAKPIIDREVEFRRSIDGECVMGEPTLFCKDFWRRGYGKIQVVPTVNVAYTVNEGRNAKKVRGRVGDTVNQEVEANNDPLVQWQITPPPMVKCAMFWSHPSWVSPL